MFYSPNETSLLRLAAAVLMETDEERQTEKRYLPKATMQPTSTKQQLLKRLHYRLPVRDRTRRVLANRSNSRSRARVAIIDCVDVIEILNWAQRLCIRVAARAAANAMAMAMEQHSEA